ncbi:MAG: hypothetical protein ACI89T_000995 [Cognaticolwellia sp.]|jgi:hypothetical protein
MVTVLGAGTAIANQDSIQFTPGNTGLARIVYTVDNHSATPSTSKMGVINVTVNQPTEDNNVPDTPNVSLKALLGENTSFELDITDGDGGADAQLISVISSDGVIVTLDTTDAENLSSVYFINKSFWFTANSPGIYSVFYTAHDHRGGYNTGLATITADGDVALMAKDASFYRKPVNNPYDFSIDLRSYITAPAMQ